MGRSRSCSPSQTFPSAGSRCHCLLLWGTTISWLKMSTICTRVTPKSVQLSKRGNSPSWWSSCNWTWSTFRIFISLPYWGETVVSAQNKERKNSSYKSTRTHKTISESYIQWGVFKETAQRIDGSCNILRQIQSKCRESLPCQTSSVAGSKCSLLWT